MFVVTEERFILLRVVITGGLGFLGSRLVSAVSSQGLQVIAPIRKDSIGRIPKIVGEQSLVEWWPIPSDDLGQVFESLPPNDVIIHCATNYGRGDNELRKVLDSNIIFPLALLEHSRKSGLQHFINIDSYFNKPENEFSSLLNYSLSKRSLLLWLSSLAGDLRVTNLRIEHMYGPGDGSHKFIPTVIRKVALEKVEHLDLTMGNQTRDFVYVDDVVDAVVVALHRAIEQTKKNDITGGMQTFEIGTGAATSVARLVRMVARASSSPTELRFGALPTQKDEVLHSKADNRFNTMFGWKYKTNLEDGIRAVLDSM